MRKIIYAQYFYLTQWELEQIKSPDIEIRLNGLFGETWKLARWFGYYQRAAIMEDIRNTERQIIGFTVHLLQVKTISEILYMPLPSDEYKKRIEFSQQVNRHYYRSLAERYFE